MQNPLELTGLRLELNRMKPIRHVSFGDKPTDRIHMYLRLLSIVRDGKDQLATAVPLDGSFWQPVVLHRSQCLFWQVRQFDNSDIRRLAVVVTRGYAAKKGLI